jgi:molybdopterin synthase catalytic subunit
MVKNYLADGPVTKEIISKFIEKMAERTDTGGHSFFLGQVRADETDGKKVESIEYSAYGNMVAAEAEKIQKTVLAEYKDAKSVDIVHSVGLVRAGEISLFVLVSAGHRHAAIQACARTVELVKEKLPVWKKEIYDNSSHSWKQNH